MPDMPDWPLAGQPWIGRSLARRHPGGGTTVLHDVSGGHVGGRGRPPAAFGYGRNRQAGVMRITHGPIHAPDGCPVSVQVFPGNTYGPDTVADRAGGIRDRFGVGRVAPVGDRGMIAGARVREDLRPVGMDWIPALANGDIRRPVRENEGREAALRPEDPVADRVAGTASPDFPAERLMVCLSPAPDGSGPADAANRPMPSRPRRGPSGRPRKAEGRKARTPRTGGSGGKRPAERRRSTSTSP